MGVANNFEQSQFKKMGVALFDILLLVLLLLRVLRESCFKVRKVPNFLQNVDFEWFQFKNVDVKFSVFYLFVLGSLQVLGEIVLMLLKSRWTNVFIIEMFIFANFEQKASFEWLQFQKVGVALPEFFELLFYWY